MKSNRRRKIMNRNLKKAVGFLGALVLSFVGVAGVSVSASAADASGEAYISLVSPVITDDMISMKADNQKMADGWVANTWFGTGLTFTKTWAPVGSTITVTYHVKDKNGNPFIDTPVNLRVGKGYSGSTAIVSVDGLKTNGVDKPPFDQANPVRKTDSFGNVSFTLVNLNDASEGEPKPTNWTDDTIPGTSLDALYIQLLPQVAGEKPDHSVMTEFHYYKNPTPVANGPATAPSIRLVSPALTDSNSVRRDDLEKTFSVDNAWYAKGITVRQAYMPVGGHAYMTYAVKDNAGKPLVNQEVKLHVGKAFSGSNAKVTDGTTPADLTKPVDADKALWIGKTDAFGTVVFHMTNTDSVGEAIPASLTTPMPLAGKGAVFSQFWPEVAGIADVADMTELHFTNRPTGVAAIAATKAVKGKYSVSITIQGKASSSAAVTVTGLPKATKKLPASGKLIYSVSVTKGTKTISVVIAGKTYKTTVKVG